MKQKKYVSTVIVAAGKAERMKRDKILMGLLGIPCIVRTMLAFEKSAETDEIVVVTRPELIADITTLAKKYGITKFREAVEGGKSRQESAANGFYAINQSSDFVCIHDGARPLIKPSEIDEFIKEAYTFNAVVAGTRVVNTIKLVNRNGMIVKTVNRDFIVAAATPQIFGRDIYAAALNIAGNKLADYTDDAGLVEDCGLKIKFCECSTTNIKITTPDDVYVAEKIITSGVLNRQKEFGDER